MTYVMQISGDYQFNHIIMCTYHFSDEFQQCIFLKIEVM